VTREFNQTIDIREFLGTPGYPMLLIAANTRLSVGDILTFLDFQADTTKGVGRSRSWIQRRRWVFQQPGTDNTVNRDGKDARAAEIMDANPTCSSRELVMILQRHLITRSREWVRLRRVSG
jgi:hypothetical protein